MANPTVHPASGAAPARTSWWAPAGSCPANSPHRASSRPVRRSSHSPAGVYRRAAHPADGARHGRQPRRLRRHPGTQSSAGRDWRFGKMTRRAGLGH